jgi:hypothetical protein
MLLRKLQHSRFQGDCRAAAHGALNLVASMVAATAGAAHASAIALLSCNASFNWLVNSFHPVLLH